MFKRRYLDNRDGICQCCTKIDRTISVALFPRSGIDTACVLAVAVPKGRLTLDSDPTYHLCVGKIARVIRLVALDSSCKTSRGDRFDPGHHPPTRSVGLDPGEQRRLRLKWFGKRVRRACTRAAAGYICIC